MKHRYRYFAFAGLFSVLAAGSAHTLGSSETEPGVREAELPVTIAPQHGTLPMSFERNKGQFSPEFKFASQGPGRALLLSATRATLSLRDSNKPNPAIIALKLRGGDEQALIHGAQLLPGVANYFRGTSENWITNVPTFETVIVDDVYPGIDAVYYGNQSHFEYDFVIKPGASPERIDVVFEGSSGLTLTADGDLIVTTGSTQLRQPKPAIFQETDGQRSRVSGEYVLRGKDRIAFQIGQYDRGKPLVIDPQLVYSIFGHISTAAHAIGVDRDGNTYIAGETDDPFNNNLTDAYVAKINAAGTAVLWKNSFGGAAVADTVSALAVDASGNVYLTGTTLGGIPARPPEQFFPTINPIQQNHFTKTAFVTKFNTSGSMVYSTILGGTGGDIGRSIAVDNLGNMYVAGETNSTDFPVAKALQANRNGAGDAFVSVLNAAGSAFIFSTYIGGSGADGANAIAVDAGGNSYVTGFTSSADFPVSYAIQPVFGGGSTDAFVFKLNPAGSAFQYSSYLGGSGAETGNGIDVDLSNNAYVAGITDSMNFPTAAALQSALRGATDAFISKFNPTGSALSYSTYLGSGGADTAQAIAVNGAGNAFVAGSTSRSDFPQVRSIRNFIGNQDGYVAEFSTGGGNLIYSTLLGGSQPPATGPNVFAEVNGIAMDANGAVYVVGRTNAVDFPITSNPSGYNFTAGNPLFRGLAPFVAKLTDDATARTSTRVEQNNAAVRYSGNWFTNSGSNHSGGSADLSLVDSSATFTFSGTGARWIGFRDAWSGIANVYVDGQLSQSVDTYSAATQYQQVLFSVTDLAPGSHTLKVEATGRRNASALSAWVWIDAFEFVSGDATPDFNISAAPMTASVTQGNSTTFKISMIPLNGFDKNVSLSVTGLGTGATGSFNPAVLGSTASILTVTTTATAQTGTFTLVITASCDSLSRTVAVTLNVNPRTSTPVWARVEQNNAAVQYTGGWYSSASANHSGGNAYLSLVNSSATFTFSGTAVRWIGLRDPWSGIANVYVDGVLKATVDTYSAATQYEAILYTITGLAPGNHKLTIVPTGNHSAAAFSSWIWVDGFESAN